MSEIHIDDTIVLEIYASNMSICRDLTELSFSQAVAERDLKFLCEMSARFLFTFCQCVYSTEMNCSRMDFICECNRALAARAETFENTNYSEWCAEVRELALAVKGKKLSVRL